MVEGNKIGAEEKMLRQGVVGEEARNENDIEGGKISETRFK